MITRKHVRPNSCFLHRILVASVLLLSGGLSVDASAYDPGSPGSYGSVIDEPGFHERGDHVGVSADVSVNHFGGEVLATAEDVQIPSIGEFGLFVRRSYSSSRLMIPLAPSPWTTRHAGPLGLGWTVHYGVLWGVEATGATNRYELVNGDGSREIFYINDGTIAPLNGKSAFISASLKLLTCPTTSQCKLHTPAGLVYTFTKDTSASPPRFVPTRVDDIHGNYWTITYEPGTAWYVEHPLIRTITEANNSARRLRFCYASVDTRKRLSSIRFGGTSCGSGSVLGTYVYTQSTNYSSSIGGNYLFYLGAQTTAAGRTTSFGYDDGSQDNYGLLNSVTLPSGGSTAITYHPISSGALYPAISTVPTRRASTITRGGFTTSYTYTPNTSTQELTVQLSRSDYSGTYVYHSYAAALCGSNLAILGALKSMTETFNGTARTFVHSYAPNSFSVSADPFGPATGCSLPSVKVPQLTGTTKTQDGTALATTFTDFNTFNMPETITAPGSVVTAQSYRNLTDTSANKYLLGGPDDRTVTVAGDEVQKTDFDYASNSDTRPGTVKFMRDGTPTHMVSVALTYYTTTAKKGAVRTRSYGNYSETLDYTNGVLSSATYGAGPPLSRAVATIGTITNETRDGITRTFTYDSDLRVTRITQPGKADQTISYTATQVASTEGTGQLTLSYDSYARLIEKTQALDGSVVAQEAWSNFNSLDLAQNQTITTGAVYSLAYDVERRVVSRSTSGDSNTFAYQTTATETQVVRTRNGTSRTEHFDHYGRRKLGKLNSSSVTTSYDHVTAGTEESISPAGQSPHTVVKDYLGNVVSENRPEIGTVTYPITAEGWIAGMNDPALSVSYGYDNLGRRTSRTVNSETVAEFIYSGEYNVLDEHSSAASNFLPAATKTGLDTTGFSNSFGKPESQEITIPRALRAPRLKTPRQSNFAFMFECKIPSFETFEWVGWGQGSIWHFELVQAGPTYGGTQSTVPDCSNGTVLERRALPTESLDVSELSVNLDEETLYCYRVREVRNLEGQKRPEIGPFSNWVAFMISENTEEPLWCSGGGCGCIEPEKPLLEDFYDMVEELSCGDIGAWIASSLSQAGSTITGDTTGDFSGCDAGQEPTEPEGLPKPFVDPNICGTGPMVTYTIDYSYDNRGRVAAVTAPAPDSAQTGAINWRPVHEFTYNKAGGHDEVAFGGADVVTNTTYHSSGKPAIRSQLVYDVSGLGGSSENYAVERGYNSLGRLTSAKVRHGPSTLEYNAQSIDYAEGTGFIASVSRADPGLNGVYAYGYDALERLASYTLSGNTVTYSWDAPGNLTGKDALAITGLNRFGFGTYQDNNGELNDSMLSPGTYDSNNHSSSSANATYDASGRVTSLGQMGHLYKFNKEERVEQVGLDDPAFAASQQNDLNGAVSEGDWPTAQFIYDANGYRVREVYDNVVVHSVRSPTGRLLYQEVMLPSYTDCPHSLRKDFIYHNDELIATHLNAEGRYSALGYHFYDHAGNNVLNLWNNHDLAKEYVEYSPHGQQMRSTIFPSRTAYEYGGHERDAATGLDYMMQRYYAYPYARMLSPDPARAVDPLNPTSYNLYAYAMHNPVNFRDPTGEAVPLIILWAATNPAAIASITAVASFAIGLIDPNPVGSIDLPGPADDFGRLARHVGPRVWKGAKLAARGGAQAVRVGQAGEAAVRSVADIGEKVLIRVGGRGRIPDGLTSTVLSEVKNVGSLSYTQQLRDFAAHASANGLRFDLWVRPTTQLSGPLAQEVANGAINLRYIP